MSQVPFTLLLAILGGMGMGSEASETDRQEDGTATSQPCMLSELLGLALLGFDPICLCLILGNLHPRSLILDLHANVRLSTLHYADWKRAIQKSGEIRAQNLTSVSGQ